LIILLSQVVAVRHITVAVVVLADLEVPSQQQAEVVH
jgi:hypothetical protein